MEVWGGRDTRWPCDVITSPTPPPVMGRAVFLGIRKWTQRAAVLAFDSLICDLLLFFSLFFLRVQTMINICFLCLSLALAAANNSTFCLG